MRRCSLRLLISLTVFVVSAASAQAQQTFTWNGGTGNWSNPLNWSPNGVPNGAPFGPFPIVLIDGGKPQSSVVNFDLSNLGSFSSMVAELQIDMDNVLNINVGANLGSAGGQVYTVGGTLNNYGQIDFGAQINVAAGGVLNNFGNLFSYQPGGDLNITGTLNNGPGATLLTSDSGNFSLLGGTINNAGSIVNAAQRIQGNGTINNLNGGVIALTSAFMGINLTGELNNEGTINLSESFVSISGPLNNAGTILTGGFSDVINAVSYVQTAGALSLLGTLSVNQGTGTAHILGGQFGGTSNTPGFTTNIEGNVISSGLLSPGALAPNPWQPPIQYGSFGILGNYQQTAGGAYTADIGGLMMGAQYDQVSISGHAALDGILTIVLQNGFVPTAGSSFTIMTFGSYSGGFQNVSWLGLPSNLRFNIQYNPNSVVVSVAPVPEPATLLFFGSGLLAIGWRRRNSYHARVS